MREDSLLSLVSDSVLPYPSVVVFCWDRSLAASVFLKSCPLHSLHACVSPGALFVTVVLHKSCDLGISTDMRQGTNQGQINSKAWSKFILQLAVCTLFHEHSYAGLFSRRFIAVDLSISSGSSAAGFHPLGIDQILLA
jgi:hypothetical protein